ncbi:Hypothetical protein CINCED_3A004369 [Cinara cedri]|uniref:Uncharacterized protein n=1 Tax=Cinara cedri TaxID=506608 RepID=A0A5E4NE83_9HEMI|nr:Hypothetical protein CINCED_3A004369 [Cinara cedri]
MSPFRPKTPAEKKKAETSPLKNAEEGRTAHRHSLSITNRFSNYNINGSSLTIRYRRNLFTRGGQVQAVDRSISVTLHTRHGASRTVARNNYHRQLYETGNVILTETRVDDTRIRFFAGR